MRKTTWVVAFALAVTTGTAAAQDDPAHRGAAPASGPIEVPLRIEEGRLLVTATGPDGRGHDLVLGLGPTLFTESGATRLGSGLDALMLEGVPVETEGYQTVPDAYLHGSDAVGVLGGHTLNGYDVLIDAPNGRLVLKPVGRAVRWDGTALSSPVSVQVFHDLLIRADVDFGGEVVGGLLDLTRPEMQVGQALAAPVFDGAVRRFRMGYGGWSDLPAAVVDSPVFRRWDAQERFVIVGAAVAYDCAIAISWYHSEIRTCLL